MSDTPTPGKFDATEKDSNEVRALKEHARMLTESIKQRKEMKHPTPEEAEAHGETLRTEQKRLREIEARLEKLSGGKK